jgi:GH18 family chitinase
LLVRQAAAKFRGVFAAGIAFYNRSNIKCSGGTEWNAQWQATFFPNQATAIEEFRVFIEPERLEAYNKAWDEYHRPQRTNGNIRFEEYYVGDELKCRNNFKTKIEAVLEFAKE